MKKDSTSKNDSLHSNQPSFSCRIIDILLRLSHVSLLYQASAKFPSLKEFADAQRSTAIKTFTGSAAIIIVACQNS